jgi:hypothetical protein
MDCFCFRTLRRTDVGRSLSRSILGQAGGQRSGWPAALSHLRQTDSPLPPPLPPSQTPLNLRTRLEPLPCPASTPATIFLLLSPFHAVWKSPSPGQWLSDQRHIGRFIWYSVVQNTTQWFQSSCIRLTRSSTSKVYILKCIYLFWTFCHFILAVHEKHALVGYTKSEMFMLVSVALIR